MPWKSMDVQDQRVQFVVSALRPAKPYSAHSFHPDLALHLA